MLRMLDPTETHSFTRLGRIGPLPSLCKVLAWVASGCAAVGVAAVLVANGPVPLPARQPTTAALADASSQFFFVTNLSSSGSGSLRAAIRRADASSAGVSSVIDFSVHGIIPLSSRLPAISRAVTIDGTSAPTYVTGGPPVVEINCNGQGGLLFAARSAGSQLLGVAVDNAHGNGVTIDARFITLNHDYVGVNLAGARFGNHGAGVYLSATSSRVRIGLNSA